MKTVAFRQYLAAAVAGLVLLGVQLHQIVLRFGTEGMHPRADLMQRQIAMELMDRPGFVAAISAFALFALVTHLLLTLGAMWVYRRACGVVLPARRDSFWRSLIFMAATVLLATIANHWLFPLSASMRDVELLMVQRLSPVLIGICIAVVASAVLVSVYSVMRHRRVLLLGVSVMALALGLGAWSRNDGMRDHDGGGHPDVIILGVDSLRPDHLSSYGEFPGGLAPAIEKTLANTVVMEDVRTPLARTFVSYNSTLTGMNPLKHGARFNLYPRSEFARDQSLVWDLKQQGYSTMLAMDESRFANFDWTFGFDTTVAPKMGAIDFVVGGSFDFFATNLMLAALPATDLLNTIQGNRAAYRSYRSVDHTQRVIADLQRVPSSAPLFLVSHLCLPHWPYLPGGLKEDNSLGWVSKIAGYKDSSSQYLSAVREADGQFDVLIRELRRLKRLDNAILIVMSDHGEDFSMDRDLLQSTETGEQVGSYGHGSFALSEVQTHVVMGIQRFRDGKPVWEHRRVRGAGSLIDVAPTVAEMIGLDTVRFEGISWLPALQGREDLSADRIRFVENGLRSAGVERPHINEREVAQEMSYLYRITDDERFEIRPELLPQKLREKQRGAVLGHIGVMTDPASSNAPGATGCWRVVNYEKRTIGCTGFPSEQPAVARLQLAVCNYYRQEPGFEQYWCHGGVSSSRRAPLASR